MFWIRNVPHRLYLNTWSPPGSLFWDFSEGGVVVGSISLEVCFESLEPFHTIFTPSLFSVCAWKHGHLPASVPMLHLSHQKGSLPLEPQANVVTQLEEEDLEIGNC